MSLNQTQINEIKNILKSIIEKSDSLFNSVKQNTIENQSLKQTCDYLLPKLISREIQVKEGIKKIKELR